MELTSYFDTAKEKFSRFEDIAIETSQNEHEGKKTFKSVIWGLAQLVEHYDSWFRSCKFEPHIECRDHLKVVIFFLNQWFVERSQAFKHIYNWSTRRRAVKRKKNEQKITSPKFDEKIYKSTDPSSITANQKK